MPGLAKTSQFLLATATIMVGPQADVFALTSDDHSIGLVKNVQAQAQPRYTELMQGVTNQTVYSVNTEMPVTVSAEVYEYTARNLAYAAGIEASGAGYDPNTLTFDIDANVTDASVSLVVDQVADLDEIVLGDWLLLSQGEGSDNIWAFKAGTVTPATQTVAFAAGFAPPDGMTFTAGVAKLYKVHGIGIGTQATAGHVGVKVVGILPEENEPVTLIYPKCRITNGLSLAFQTENFSNMPFEFKPYALLPTDPFYSALGPNQSALMLRR